VRAWVLPQIGDIDRYRLVEVEDPVPGPGEARVRVRASALNHMDLWVARGRPEPPLPHVPGADGAGVVDAFGEGVEGITVGDEVVINPAVGCGTCGECARGQEPLCRQLRIVGEHLWGTHADAVVVPARNLHPKPSALSWEDAGAYGLAMGNAYRLLRRARLAGGETVLVVGFGGGVSSAALLLALAVGARVWVTTRDADKGRRALELGAEGWFDSGGDFDEGVREATGDRGVDLVFETVGPATWQRSVRALTRGGRLATCGGTSGPDVTLNLPTLFWRHLEIVGASVQSNPEFSEVTRLVGDGAVPVLIDRSFGFSDYPAALTHLAASGQVGKVTLRHHPD
jgi:zinc-binding alcohol dehydrogenase/oxidoreductase